MKTIGQRIRERRLELHLSVDELAGKIGKNRATIYRYENDQIKDYPSSTLEPLALALKTTPADLMGWPLNRENDESKEGDKDREQGEKENVKDIQDDEWSLVKKYRLLNKSCRQTVDAVLDMAVELSKAQLDEYSNQRIQPQDTTDILKNA